MNNFVFSQDPLLYSSIVPKMNSQEQMPDIKQQLDQAAMQYQLMQQQMKQQQQPMATKDYVGELDDLIKTIEPEVFEILSKDEEYMKTNNELQGLIQEEMLKSVKWKINNNQTAVSKIDKLKDLISQAKKSKTDEEKRNLAELNDYIKNYPDLTFEEYKQLKNKK